MTDETKEIYGVVYKATDPNGKCYIGLHKGDGSDIGIKYFGSGLYVKRAIKTHGKYHFSYDILKKCSSLEELNLSEKYFIKFFDSTNKNKGFNFHEGGNMSDYYLKLSEEGKRKHRAKLSESQQRPETRQKHSIAMKGKNTGPFSEERRNKHIEMLLRVHKNPELNQKISDSMKGKNTGPRSEEAKRNMSVAQCIAQNRPEQKKKNSDSNKIAHNRPEVKARQTERGICTNHTRWHIKRNIVNPNCKLCMENK